MRQNHLHACKQLARDTTALLFQGVVETDAIQDVIIFIKDHHPQAYALAAAESGAGVVHAQIGKVVKAALGARNDRRYRASAYAPCKTFQGLQAQ